MPLLLPPDHPVRARLAPEGVHVLPQQTAPPALRVGILNLMPEKQEAEYHLLAHLGHFPLPWKPIFLMTATHRPTHCPREHLERFYTTWETLLERSPDPCPLHGLIVTGAPVELLPFSQVTYWEELSALLSWADRQVPGGTLHICWAAQAGLFLRYGIGKRPLKQKLSGLFTHHRSPDNVPILSGMDDTFLMPHSRHTELEEEALLTAQTPLRALITSPEAGTVLLQSPEGRQTYLTGHPEYPRTRLDEEYRRDLARRLPVPRPAHYYPQDRTDLSPLWTWKAHARLLYLNWLAGVHALSSPLSDGKP